MKPYRSIFFLATMLTMLTAANAQKIYTKNGSVSFFSKAPIENISAENNQVTSILVMPSGDLQFSVLIKSFHFKKSMMEQHFNEDYLESAKFPKAIFKGKISNPQSVNITSDGSYPVEVSGGLTIHGVTKNVTTPANITVKAGVVSGSANFRVRLADYQVKIPGIVKDNIAEVVDVSVSCIYDQKM